MTPTLPTANAALDALFIEARALVSQYQTADDRRFSAVLRFRDTIRRVCEDRVAGATLRECNDDIANARLDAENLSRYDIPARALVDTLTALGRRFLGWEC